MPSYLPLRSWSFRALARESAGEFTTVARGARAPARTAGPSRHHRVRAWDLEHLVARRVHGHNAGARALVRGLYTSHAHAAVEVAATGRRAHQDWRLGGAGRALTTCLLSRQKDHGDTRENSPSRFRVLRLLTACCAEGSPVLGNDSARRCGALLSHGSVVRGKDGQLVDFPLTTVDLTAP